MVRGFFFEGGSKLMQVWAIVGPIIFLYTVVARTLNIGGVFSKCAGGASD